MHHHVALDKRQILALLFGESVCRLGHLSRQLNQRYGALYLPEISSLNSPRASAINASIIGGSESIWPGPKVSILIAQGAEADELYQKSGSLRINDRLSGRRGALFGRRSAF